MPLSWIRNTENDNKKVNEQEQKNITILKLNAALTKSLKRKSPRIDKVPNFWLNVLFWSHVMFKKLLNEIMQNPEKTPE